MKLEKLTPASVQAVREWYAENALACIAEVGSGEVRVNDTARYIADCRARREAALAGEYDHTFAFWQRAYLIQTGECVPLLSK